MRRALNDAHLEPNEVGYINAHGTATVAGDRIETESIKAVFGEHARALSISSTKSAHGHLMGASGAVEFLATAMALREQVIPPTTHWSRADPECDLDYVPGVGRKAMNLNVAMCNSFAFGGNNAVLVVKRCS
jgi:3-oxoacyl-(acyl-carrier-protein) synthase